MIPDMATSGSIRRFRPTATISSRSISSRFQRAEATTIRIAVEICIVARDRPSGPVDIAGTVVQRWPLERQQPEEVDIPAGRRQTAIGVRELAPPNK